MKFVKSLPVFLIVLLSLFSLTSCEVVGGIFKAGMWVGVIAVVAIVGVLIFIFMKITGSKGDK